MGVVFRGVLLMLEPTAIKPSERDFAVVVAFKDQARVVPGQRRQARVRTGQTITVSFSIRRLALAQCHLLWP